jgi:hypothetical protein
MGELMSVKNVSPEYSDNIIRWELINKIVKNDAKDEIRYLDPYDLSEENTTRNIRYRDDAVLVNFTALTLEGLAGLIFRKPPKTRLPRELDYLKEDAAEDGRTLNQVAHDIIVEQIKLGRVFALVDFPRSENDLETRENDLHAKISLYEASDVDNWSVARINGKLQLNMVKIHECKPRIQADGFTWLNEERWRVLRLEPKTPKSKKYIYRQYLYHSDGNIDMVEPKDFNGNHWDVIPGGFAGAQNNSAKVNKSPLYDIVLLNRQHYRNSADLEESGHVVGQPTLILKVSMGAEDFAAANPNGLKLGSRAAYNVGPEGDAKFLQVNPNQLIAEMMKQKEHQAAFIGARLIAPAGGRETAEAARMRFGSSNSALAHLVDNANVFVNQLLKWIARFEGANEKLIQFKLNNVFFDENIDPQVVMQGIMMVNEEILPRSTIQNYARNVGYVDEDITNEELDREIEKTSKLNRDLMDDEEPINKTPDTSPEARE